MKVSTVRGEDDEMAWNDAHFQHVYFWLVRNPNSPYFGAPSMLMGALKVEPVYRENMKKAFQRANFSNFRFSTRITITAALKRVLSGLYEPEILSRTKKGIVLKFVIRPAANPQPLACPPFYRGSIKMTPQGMKVQLRQSDAVMATSHNPDGVARLKNPWGKL
jgi:hypothetical protein